MDRVQKFMSAIPHLVPERGAIADSFAPEWLIFGQP